MVRHLKILLGLYFIFLLVVALFIFPDQDTFYYWDWGNHLAFSYLDGPPMIAYMLHFSSILFGNTFFAMNIVAILCGAGVCYCIYKMGVLLCDQETGLLAACLWAFNPFVVRSFFTYVTYDLPESLFWAVLMYVSICYILSRKTKFLYLMGVAAGLLLLSKYTGLVLIVAILIYFVSQRELRCVFKNSHFYLAGILSLLLFSPVLIWNVKYHWVGFVFQLQQHARLGQHVLYQNYWMIRWQTLGTLLGNFNILLLLPLWVFFFKRADLGPSIKRFFIVVSIVFIGIWLFVDPASPRPSYLLPLVISLALLTSDVFLRLYRLSSRGFIVVLGTYLGISIICFFIETPWMNLLMFDAQRYQQYGEFLLAKSILSDAKAKGVNTIITSGWSFSGQLDFLAKKMGFPEPILLQDPNTPGSMGAHQFWSQTSLQPGQFAKVLYVAEYPVTLKSYFKFCTPLKTVSFSKEQAFTHKLLSINLVESYCYN